METIFGFVAGYLAGCQDGPDGVKRLRASVEAILRSDEVKRLTQEAMTAAELAVRRAASARGLPSNLGEVSDILVHRATAIAKGSRAA
jgi:hypothetical protein